MQSAIDQVTTMLRRLDLVLDWLGEHGVLVMVAALLVVVGTWGFVELADEVLEGSTQQFDEWAVNLLRKPNPDPNRAAVEPVVAVGPPWVREIFRDLTALGGMIVLALVTLAVVGYLLMARKFHAMWLVIIATGGGLILSNTLKAAFDRPRPTVPYLSEVITSSFPSGHSMLSAIVYLTLGSLLAQLSARRRMKLYFLLLAAGASFLVGLSRIYMGVHFPTDVLAGWTAGLVWAILCWLIARFLQRRGKVESEV